MSDANLLAPRPVEWADGGRTYKAAVCDLDDELYFQMLHEAAAVGRIDAVRERISPQAYETRMRLLNADTNANRFAFGGPLCMDYLWTDAGRAAYLWLLMDKGSRKDGGASPPPEAELARRLRDEDAGLVKTWLEVLRRDFPRVAARIDALSSGTTGGP